MRARHSSISRGYVSLPLTAAAGRCAHYSALHTNFVLCLARYYSRSIHVVETLLKAAQSSQTNWKQMLRLALTSETSPASAHQLRTYLLWVSSRALLDHSHVTLVLPTRVIPDNDHQEARSQSY